MIEWWVFPVVLTFVIFAFVLLCAWWLRGDPFAAGLAWAVAASGAAIAALTWGTGIALRFIG